MSSSRSAGQDRVARSGRRPDPSGAALTPLNRDVLAVLCAHRVVTQEQLGRLFPAVPERTLRYRTRRLHDLGLLGRSRPYRDCGSAPNHHWPTRHADCLMRGDPVPRGGERRRPNPVFLAHAAALTDLYVALSTGVGGLGLTLEGYGREGAAREVFEFEGRERAIAPDVGVHLRDKEGRDLLAFVEVDLGTMSHARLRQKAELYAAYTEAGAWEGRFRFLPALLFLTTSDVRAGRFLKALGRALSYGRKRRGRREFVAAVGGLAFAPGRLLVGGCLEDLDGNSGLGLVEVLSAARAPYERVLARQRERRKAEEERRRVLWEDGDAMREHLRRVRYALAEYVKELGPLGERTVELLLAGKAEPTLEERGMLRAFGGDLDEALLEPFAHKLPRPGSAVAGAVELLTGYYRRAQRLKIKALTERHGSLPCLRLASSELQGGGLLAPDALERLPGEVERNLRGRHEQHERYTAHLKARERMARGLVKQAGRLARLTRRPEDFYEQIDRERLRICLRCGEVAFPPAPETSGYGSHTLPQQCHYCGGRSETEPYCDPMSSTESEDPR